MIASSMETLVTTDDADRRHDVKIGLLLLSLDAVMAHAEPLDLGFGEPTLVKEAARRCAAWWSNPRENQAGPLTPVIAAMRACLDGLGAGASGPRVVAWLDRFLSALATTSATDAWVPVLTRYDAEHEAALRQLGLGAQASVTVGRLAREYATRAAMADALVDQIEATVDSPWDRAQFDQYRSESELIAPTDYLFAWLQAEAVLAALAGVVRELRAEEFRVFTEWVKAAAAVEFRTPESRLAVPRLSEIVARYEATLSR